MKKIRRDQAGTQTEVSNGITVISVCQVVTRPLACTDMLVGRSYEVRQPNDARNKRVAPRSVLVPPFPPRYLESVPPQLPLQSLTASTTLGEGKV